MAFLTGREVVDRLIGHLELTSGAEKPWPFHVFEEMALTAANGRGEQE
ncbi:MAG: acid--CoA ligase [Candidatus Aminicenantales bacterium]